VNVLQHAMIGKRLRKELKDVAALFGRTRGWYCCVSWGRILFQQNDDFD
jgi:hypothetical protein